jgi:serine/threonine protein kinase
VRISGIIRSKEGYHQPNPSSTESPSASSEACMGRIRTSTRIIGLSTSEISPNRPFVASALPALYPGAEFNINMDLIAKVNKELVNYDRRIKYIIVDYLGSGAFGQVLTVRNAKNGKQYAAKVFKACQVHELHLSHNEISITVELNKLEKKLAAREKSTDGIIDYTYPKIVKLKDYFEMNHIFPQDGWNMNLIQKVVIYEKLSMSLFDIMQSLEFQGASMTSIQHFAHYLLEGLLVLQIQRVTHGDIKPENIMMYR